MKLRDQLRYEPKVLKFGTSGRRGDVIDLSQLEIYINVSGELKYLQSLDVREGGIKRGEEFYFGYDLRPSSTRFDGEQKGRGEIAQVIEKAIRDSGMKPINLGDIPTPAVMYHASRGNKGSIMVTGSHIPFDRNGYKTNSCKGELLKWDEIPILQFVEKVREELYNQNFEESIFNEEGMLKEGHRDLSPVDVSGKKGYITRYIDFFPNDTLKGQKILVYQHSAVGRDILAEILELLGARVIAMGRSDTFVPIDTENIDKEQLDIIQKMTTEAWMQYGVIDAVISTDGDSDRPLLLGVEGDTSCRVRFYDGDLLGMIMAEYLDADAVVVPISCNDGIDKGPLKNLLEPKTKIGSPYVISGMEKALASGRKVICGWEANGGFLLGSDIQKDGRGLRALPTRDAILPILSVLSFMTEKKLSMKQLFARLPKRYGKSGLLKKFPRETSLKIVKRCSPGDINIKDAYYDNGQINIFDEDNREIEIGEKDSTELKSINSTLSQIFLESHGFDDIARINYVDGVRVYFRNGDIAHLRPSGNADELRIYAVANTRERAEKIVKLGVEEPMGILKQMEVLVK